MPELNPRVRLAQARHLEELAAPSAGGPKMLSLYLNLDPSTFGTAEARQSAVRSLVSEATAEIEKVEGDEKKMLRESLGLVESYLENDEDWAKDANGLAIFCSVGQNLFEVLKLPFSPDQKAVVEQGAMLEPLQSELTGNRFCVVLVNRRTYRIYLGRPHDLREVVEDTNDVRGQHSAGGWSQRRFEQSVEEDVRDHLEEPAERLLSLLKRDRFDHLVVSAADELWPQFEHELNSEVAERVVGRINVEAELASVEDIEAELEELASRLEAQAEKQLLEDLEQNLGRGEKAAAGLDDVLAALVEMKVETLLVEDGLDVRGVACRSCHWLAKAGDSCPVDGGELESDINMAERAAQLCLSTSAEVHMVRDAEPLKQYGGWAAILRF